MASRASGDTVTPNCSEISCPTSRIDSTFRAASTTRYPAAANRRATTGAIGDVDPTMTTVPMTTF